MRNSARYGGTILAMLTMAWAVETWAAKSAAGTTDAGVLLRAYLSHGVVRQVEETGKQLAKGLSPAEAAQVNEAVVHWAGRGKQAIRKNLEDRFQGEARQVFSFFVRRYQDEERKSGPEYLSFLVSDLGLDPPPKTYAELRQHVADRSLKGEIRAGSRLLSNIQTWIDLKHRNPGIMALQDWLSRDEPTASPSGTPSTLGALAAAESPLPEFRGDADAGSAVLDAYGAARRQRRSRALAEAQAGMQQVAAERQAAEEDSAKRKMAEAQREAEAVKAYAQKLADVEKEALEQRQNTWGARLKKITVGILSGATGAITTGVGAGAGAAIADEVFD